MGSSAPGELTAPQDPTVRPSVRLIPRLDVKGPNVVRGIHLEGLRVVGKPEEMARSYAEAGADELIFIDTVASLYGRNNMLDVVERTSEDLFIPLTVGGGIRTLDDVAAALRAGADKVTVNSAAIRRPALVREIAEAFGSQCVVLAVEAKRTSPKTWTAYIENGREPTEKDAVEWAKEGYELGAGEILVTSIDQDGMKTGFDTPLIRQIASAVPIPVIASGGAGSVEHVVEIFTQTEASAVALGTILHFRLAQISAIKQALAERGVRVRA